MRAVFPATIDVSQLNGQNGFMISGGVGNSVSGIGDVNKDGIADLIIGAPDANSGTGASYVIFGGSEIGSSGTLNVADLNGANGFMIVGFGTNAEGGNSVSGAGDVNKDGVADLIIGAPQATNSVGSSYVIFGGSGIGNSGTLNVASLNGVNGFNITGFSMNAQGGRSVSNAGDVNKDNVTDLIIGTLNANAVYVVFGGSGIGSTGKLSVASLNGNNGFNVIGFPASAYGGWSVSNVGDVNKDGVADLIIGAPYANSTAGAVYVVFGGSNIGSSGTLNVASLNGTNGFNITGFLADAQAGYSVSSVGDVNKDGVADLIIGAPISNSGGAAYVVFGGSGIGSSGTLNVVSLNGTNGFNINGFPTGAFGGSSVSSAGDVNKDGVADLIIGAPRSNSNAGAAYVVFGGSDISGSGALSVASLNGTNGFNVTGFPAGAQAGSSVSGAGDINNDGITDLIIGSNNENSYVIFGDSLDLVNNQLTIRRGGTQLLNATNLNATDTKHNLAAIQFVITNLQQGEFALVSNPSQAITNFTQLQVNAQQVQFKQDGSFNLAPSYDVSVYHSTTGFAYVPPAPAQVNYISIVPSLGNNRLTINQGQTVVLTPTDLSATDTYDNIANLIFNISNIQNGQFTSVNSSAISLTQFTQGNVTRGDIQFIQDGSSNAPSYAVTVIDSYGFTDGPALGSITFNSDPKLINNFLNINQGQAVTLNSANLLAVSGSETPSSNLLFTASAIQHGQFEYVNNTGVAITTFLQQKITESSVAFVQDDSSHSPFYNMSVSDGTLSTIPMPVTVSFNVNPPQDIASNNNTARNAAIGASISGAMLVGFFLGTRYFSNRKAKQDLNDLLVSDTTAVEKEQKLNGKVVSLVANKIFESLKTTNIFSYRSLSDTRDFLLAIEQMIWKLSDSMVNLDFDAMDAMDCGFLLSEIARETRRHAISSTGYYTNITHFFRAEITPQQLSSKAQEIATAVKETVAKSRPYLILEPGVSLPISRQSIVRNPKDPLEMKLVMTNSP